MLMENEELTVFQSSVAQALATDYFCIYYVNINDDRFIEYSASPEYRALGLPATGNDFIAFSREKFDSLVYPEDRERFLETFTKEHVLSTLDQHSTFTMTFRLLFQSVPTFVHLKVTRMIEKEVRHVVVGISSIDEQMKVREAYERAHHASITYSRIAQALAEDYFCIYYVDMSTDHFIEYSSDEAYKALGIETTGPDFFEVARTNARRVIYEDDLGAFLAVFTKENIQQVLDVHKTFTLSYRLILSGVLTYVSMKATRMKDEDGNHIIIGINNIDAQMRQQAEYQQVEKQRITYNRVARTLARDYIGIYVVDMDTDHFMEYCSTDAYEQLGLEKAGEAFFATCQRNIQRVVYEEDQDRLRSVFTKERVMSILARDGIFTTKYRLLLDGVPTYVSMKASLLEDKDGRHLIIGVNNIDAQMKREQEYQAHMANARTRARNDFLTNMSHDIRTPMNAIVGYTNIAREHLSEPEIIRDSLEKIGSSSHFLLSLINDILDISKIESGKMQLNTGHCDLAAILGRIEDITSLQAKSKQLRITYSRDVRHYRVLCDELRLEQVLINIISNAIKYTPEGGDVWLTAQEIETGACHSRYRFIVRDTGVGISEAYLPHIFESFTREKRTTINKVQGTGLGLAITAQIVRLMNGTISVHSEIGEGTEFTVEVDFERQETEEQRGDLQTEKDIPDLSGYRVLLIEDNEINAEIARMVLTQYGMEVDHAENGQAGIERLWAMGEDYYRAVLMDIQMPVMNGYEATRAIRGMDEAYYQRLPIIAMSANAYDEDVRDALASGMNAHIAKPFDPERLVRLLCTYML